MATNTMLPVSNVAGNNQHLPGVGLAGAGGTAGGSARGGVPTNPVFTPPQTGVSGAGAPQNPFLQGIGSVRAEGTTMLPMGPGGSGAGVGAGAGDSSGLFDPKQLQLNQKQLIDIFGKGVGGSLGALLGGMSGETSKIFQQWLASQIPVQAKERTQLATDLGARGVSANSSVAGIAGADLEAQFNAQAAGVNADLMRQNLQDTIGILTGMEPAAQKEVERTAWTDFANVMNNITGDIGNLFGGSYQSPQPQGSPAGPMVGATTPGQLPSFAPAQGDPTNYNSGDWGGLDTSGGGGSWTEQGLFV